MVYRLPMICARAAALAATAGLSVPGPAWAEPVAPHDVARLAADQCATAGEAGAAQKAAFAASVLLAVERLERFDPKEAKALLERILLCCELVAALDRSDRTLIAARLAYAARLMAEHDPELARELDRLVDLCGDRVVDVNYGAARGSGRGGSAGAASFGGSSGVGGGGGGGVPTAN